MQLRIVHIVDKSVHDQLPQESGSACHAGELGFFVKDEFFIIAQIEDDLVFPRTVFVSVFVHFRIPLFLVLDGFMSGDGWKFSFGDRYSCSGYVGVRGSPLCSKMHVFLVGGKGRF